MARPKKNPAQVKADHLRIPMTAEQKRLVADAAQKAGSDMAPWARDVLVRAATAQLTGGRKKK